MCSTWPPSTSTANAVRSVSSPRCARLTADAIAVRGVRSSWLTSEVNRCSRAMRCSSDVAISLKEDATGARSTSWPTSNRRVRSPALMARAATATSANGRMTRRDAIHPANAPITVVIEAATIKSGLEGRQRALVFGQRDELEVLGIEAGQSSADNDVRDSVHIDPLAGRAGGLDCIDEAGRESVLVEVDDRRMPHAVQANDSRALDTAPKELMRFCDRSRRRKSTPWRPTR